MRSETAERALRTGVMCLAAVGVAITAREVWRDFADSPTFVSLESTQHPTSLVPFPAVALCGDGLRLSRCARDGGPERCEAVFAPEDTPAGRCLVFRSRGRSAPPSVAMGLVVEVLPPDDSTEGFEVLVFEDGGSGRVPDPTGGGCHRRFATFGHANYLDLGTKTIASADAVKSVSAAQRGCASDGDLEHSECLRRCRTELFRGLYGRAPLFPDDGRLWTVTASGPDGCERCRPDCSGTRYRLRHSRVRHSQGATLVHVYFAEHDGDLYRIDVVYYWFEIVCNFGGVGGLFVGLSLVSLAEFALRLALRFGRRRGVVDPIREAISDK